MSKSARRFPLWASLFGALLPLLSLLPLLLQPAPAHAGDDDPKIVHERYRLDNGLEVILHKDNRVPLVAVNVWYHVGSGDEQVGKSGFAHLFEHMLFQGSEHVGEDQHFNVLRNIGGTGVNGSTNSDRTNYYELVPSHQLEVALWLESDRMGYFLKMLTEPSLKNQIDVVRNERRQSYDTVPYGKSLFAISQGLYPEGHPYRYMTIGRHEDLEGSNLADVKAFYLKWYTPANATLTLAGDFEIESAKKLVARWFGTFPRTYRPEHTPPAMPVIKQSRIEVQDEFAQLRRIDYAWHTPAFFHSGDSEFDILGQVLSTPGTGRLYRILVHEKQLAQSVAAYQASRMFSSYFQISVTLKSDADLAEVEKIVNEEVERVVREPVSDREFKRVVVQQEAAVVWGLEALMARAEQLQLYNHYVGTPDYLTQDLDRLRKSSPEKVRDAAAQYLKTEHRVEVLTVPAERGKGGNQKEAK